MTVEGWTDRRLRHSVAIEVAVHLAGGEECRALISDLSVEGCRLEGAYPIGERIELDVPNVGRVKGQVRWAIGGRSGVRFLPDEQTA